MKRLLLLALMAAFLTITTVGCNAARGAGKDISDTGKHISNIGT